MKYAIQKDGHGARVIESEDDVGDNEFFSETLPEQPVPSSGGFAVRKDGLGWRSVDSVNDINADETFSKSAPAVVVDLAAAARALRAPLLTAADNAINEAEDNGRDTVALRAYRQALRDITNQNKFPEEFTWPVMPQ